MISAAACLLILLLAVGLLALGWRAWQNHLEITRLRRGGGHRRVRVPFRRHHRGAVDPDLLRGLAELCLLILLLSALCGWLALHLPSP
ncbi:hypothetical protein [Prosthecobacter sp.]|uniref:hypothetical protein n=1 Tax=Prosthecobacter sp. TaxID=1965333 RepID=UPI00378415A9